MMLHRFLVTFRILFVITFIGFMVLLVWVV